MRYFLVYGNPLSGIGRGKKTINQVKDLLLQHELKFHLVTEKIELGTDVSWYQQQGFTDLVLIGGDGTINEGVNLFHPLGLPVMMFPAGRGNDYVKNFDLGATLKEQFETLLSGKTTKVDLGVCNGRKFLNGVGIGFDGQIVANMKGRKSWLSGHAAYLLEVVKILSFYRSRNFKYTLDGTSLDKKAFLMTIAKGTTFGGGFIITPNARVADGLLDVCMIKPMPGLKRFLFIKHLQKGTHIYKPVSETFKGTTITVAENAALQAHMDGEWIGTPPFEFSIIKEALEVIVVRN